MKADYNKLVELLKKYNSEDELKNIEVYVGEINGKYDTEYSIEKKEVLDTIISDGDIFPSFDNGKVFYEVNDAKYTFITRYGNSKDNSKRAEIEKVFLFIDEYSLSEIRSFLLQYDQDYDFDLYLKIFNSKNYKGSVGNYEKDDEKGQVIYPSYDLISYNKRLHNKVSSKIMLKKS